MKFLTITLLFLSLSCAPKGPNAKALTNQNTEVLVCKGKSSYAYHDHYCTGLNRCRAQVVKMSVKEARKIGRTPCGYCYNSAPINNNVQKATYQSRAQCQAITKRGTRCSRNARSGGYCWQHGG